MFFFFLWHQVFKEICQPSQLTAEIKETSATTHDIKQSLQTQFRKISKQERQLLTSRVNNREPQRRGDSDFQSYHIVIFKMFAVQQKVIRH